MFALMKFAGSGAQTLVHGIVTGNAVVCGHAYSRNARRRILPTGVFGSSVLNSMYLGRL